MTDTDIAARLEYLRGEIHAERISMGEIVELQGYGAEGHIPAGDVELREAAGLPEFPNPCEVDDCDRNATECVCGAAHCPEHPCA